METTNKVEFTRTTVIGSIVVTSPEGPMTVMAGSQTSVYATAYDAWNNFVAPNATIGWTTTNGTLLNSSSYTDETGSAYTTLVVNTTAGTQHVVTATGSASASSPIITTVHSDMMGSWTVTGPTSMTAGTSANFTGTLYDIYGNLMSTYSGTRDIDVEGATNSPNSSNQIGRASCRERV